jgi:hypothetical protein
MTARSCRLARTTGRVAWLVVQRSRLSLGLDDGSEEALLGLFVRRLGGVCRLAFTTLEAVAWLVVQRLGGVCRLACSTTLEAVAWLGRRLGRGVAWLVLVILSPSREGRLISSSDSVKS